ncbi:gamma-glutamylcyclotransferase [Proteiniclasticum sp. C24MP]|uniref:gamma-glutamylcyclotransferase family protein n=1 Tax=Proteiniclasticum sp. C24MP TaxID=3374101 RepID=UPI00375439D4
MKNTFYRPQEVDTRRFEEIMKEMKANLNQIISGEVEKEEARSYAENLIREAKPLEKNPEMMFWGFSDPQTMPSDSRVRYFYTPSYLAVSTLAYMRLYGPEEAHLLEGFQETLRKGLLGATGRAFSGAGHDGLKGMIEAFDLFQEAKIHHFVDAYPEICPAFTSLFLKTRSYLTELVKKDKVRNAYGEAYTEEAKSVLLDMKDMETEAVVFVYGTLLRGIRNHDAYLRSAKYLGEAKLSGYGLYDLGSYPGIRRKQGNRVKGEVYAVDRKTLERLHELEGEGSLYAYEEVMVEMDGKEMQHVGTYRYLHEVKEENQIPYEEQPYGKERKEKNLVWYAAYGSNMLEERFLHYIHGGCFRGKGRNQKPCADTSSPRAKRAYVFDHDMYYAKESGAWEHGGVSFLDVTKPGKAYGVAYLITEEQLNHLWIEENGGHIPTPGISWYDHKADLGTMDGYPVMTVTNRRVLEKNEPGERYKNVLMEGLRENHKELSEEEVRAYVESRNR